MSSDNVAIVAVLLIVASAVLLRPVMRAWARRLGGQADAAPLADEVGELMERMAELEGAVGRLHELEERLDFAERLLAKSHEPQRELPRERLAP